MNILQIYQVFNPEVASGAAKVASEISKELANRKHNVVFLASDMKDWFTKGECGKFVVNNVLVYRFKTHCLILSKIFKIYITPKLIFMTKNWLKEFHIIHLHGYISFQNIVIAHYAKKYGVPYVLQAHGSLPRIGAWRRLKWFYDVLFGYRLLRDAAKVIALSGVEAEQYRAMGVPEEKIAIIPNGIDLSEYANLPPKGSFKKKFGIPEEKKIILYLGRIHKTKGIDFLVKAYAHLVKNMNFKNAVLVIAGPDDGYLNEVKPLTHSLSVSDSVLFTGFVSGEDKLKALVDAEVFVTPSFYGFPMTFLEACAVGAPIVTTNLGDTLEWIDGNVGYATRPNPRSLAEAIYRILSDDELHKSFSINCIKTVSLSFSIEKVVEKLEEIYREVTKKCSC